MLFRLLCIVAISACWIGCDVRLDTKSSTSTNRLGDSFPVAGAPVSAGHLPSGGGAEIKLRMYSKLGAELNDLAEVLGDSNAEPSIFSLFESDPKQAVERINQIVQGSPENGFAYYVRGVFFYNLGNHKKAIEDLSKAVEMISPRILERKPNVLADIYAVRGNSHLAEKHSALAILDFSKALTIDQSNPDLYCLRGVAHAQAGQFGMAITDYTSAINLNTNNAFAHFGRAVALHNQSQLQSALDDYSTGLGLDPDYADGLFNRGKVLSDLGKHREALADLDQYLLINSNDVEALVFRADQYLRLSERQRALEDLSAAISLRPGDYDLFMRRAVQFLELGEWERAKEDLVVALELNPTNAPIQNELAWFLATCPVAEFRNGSRAVELAKKACGDTASLSYLGTLAASYAEVGDFDLATKFQKQTISLMATNNPHAAEEKLRLDLFEQRMPFRQDHPHVDQ